MYCFVCESCFEEAKLCFCTACARMMCDECRQQHSLYYGEDQAEHNVTNLCDIKTFFDLEETSDLNKCRNKHDKDAEYYCEICQEFTCHSCLTLYHQHHKNKKLQKYEPQIRNALLGCKNMIDAKEQQLLNIKEEIGRRGYNLHLRKKDAEKLIKQTSKEILFRVAMALRRREKSMRSSCMARFENMTQINKGLMENVNYFLEIFEKAKHVVEKLSNAKSVPLQKEVFTNLSLLNKLDMQSLSKQKAERNNAMLPKFSNPSDDDIEQVCQCLLKEETSNEVYQTQGIANGKQNGIIKATSYKNEFAAINDDVDHNNGDYDENDDGMSFGETDEDFGEFFIVGSPKVDGLMINTQHIVRGPNKSLHQELHGTPLESNQTKSIATTRKKVESNLAESYAKPSNKYNQPAEQKQYFKRKIYRGVYDYKRNQKEFMPTDSTELKTIRKTKKLQSSDALKSNSQSILHHAKKDEKYSEIDSGLRSQSDGDLISSYDKADVEVPNVSMNANEEKPFVEVVTTTQDKISPFASAREKQEANRTYARIHPFSPQHFNGQGVSSKSWNAQNRMTGTQKAIKNFHHPIPNKPQLRGRFRSAKDQLFNNPDIRSTPL